MSALFIVPLIIFMGLVAPLWLVLHYRSQRRVERGLSEQERESLDQLSQRARQLSQRLTTLEQLLDQNVPDWRDEL
ncbi:envelope stress response membrane protein PspB [Aliagarivorans marinus]|uniref:envelope stress response membrane protein PspB n=1 Tax=Aliagarivorans marinus TaxID=561965 RepID=UPI00040D9A9E|nr:envelope stress response membrane protein PspB [Aliagarivorans marinus]